MATVTRISIAPIKGLGLVHPDEVELELTGVRTNRRFHIVDADGRRYNQIRNGTLVQIRPQYDAGEEHLSLTFPDGTTVAADVELGDETTTDFYGRPVRGRVVEGPFAEALSKYAGRELHLVQSAPGAAVDRSRGHVSVISDASLKALAEHGERDEEKVDGRRFRMLFQVDGVDAHGEDEWLGRRVRIGEALIHLRGTVGRCAITTQNPETGVPDFDTLRVLESYRGFTKKARGNRELDFGVYGEVLEAGVVRVGDAAEPLELSLLDASA
jgi:uncharacterized protein YcbX